MSRRAQWWLFARALGSGGGLTLGLLGCGEPTRQGTADRCQTVIWAQALRPGEALAIAGSWDDWSATTPMTRYVVDPAWQFVERGLEVGEYGYLVVEEGAGRLDQYNGSTTFRASDAQEVSLLRVPDCQLPRAIVDSGEVVQAGEVGLMSAPTLELDIRLVPAASGASIDPGTVRAQGLEGVVSVEATDPVEGTAVIGVRANAPGKHTFELTFEDADAVTTPPVTVVTWVDPVAETWEDGIVYQVMVDRFRGDEGVPLADPATPGVRAGGTLPGVTAMLRDGYFAALGVSALWLSPVYTNPQEAREGVSDGQMYDGYHGYWVLDSRGVDPRLGGQAALRTLVAEAHAQGIRVLLDLVPNHIYESNPRVAEGAAQGWFNNYPSDCLCGTPSCPWSDFVLSCWFAPYLPDLRFQNADVMRTVVEDAVWWHEEFGTDGFRIDAVPMMPRAATRAIAHALRQATAPRDAAFTIGEVFTGPGKSGTDDLRYFLGPDGLDSAFDFPLMWSLREVVAKQRSSFAELDAGLSYSDQALAGSGAEMRLGRMIGNHDVSRFASEVRGDVGPDGWTDLPVQAVQDAVYERQRLALGLVLTLPGLPVIYYGDEIALAGGPDPDNRRVLPAMEALSTPQQTLLDGVRRVARLRRCMPALRRGGRETRVAGSTQYAFVRAGQGLEPALVVASSAAEPSTWSIPVGSALADGRYVDALGGAAIEVGGGMTQGAADGSVVVVTLEARALAVFVPEASACLE